MLCEGLCSVLCELEDADPLAFMEDVLIDRLVVEVNLVRMKIGIIKFLYVLVATF